MQRALQGGCNSLSLSRVVSPPKEKGRKEGKKERKPFFPHFLTGLGCENTERRQGNLDGFFSRRNFESYEFATEFHVETCNRT